MADEESDPETVYSEVDVERKNNFLASCRELRDKVATVESIQIDILITLLTSADATGEVSLTLTCTALLPLHVVASMHMMHVTGHMT